MIRLGFLGLGWIGQSRLAAIAAVPGIEVAAVCDPSAAAVTAALAFAPSAKPFDSLGEMLDEGLDGVVVATPSAQHAAQAVQALAAGAAVFCQKPLGRNQQEVQLVVTAARAADRLLGVDFSYRFVTAAQRIADVVRSGTLGDIFAVDLTFHNAYGPDKAWFFDPAQSGGGCVVDLGVHLVDLAQWLLGHDEVTDVSAVLRRHGRAVAAGEVEDFATANFQLNQAHVRLACSWHLHAGRDAVIAVTLHGTEGGASLRNVGGSFYDFTADLYRGTASERLASPPDDWSGRAAADWARRLVAGERFDPAAQDFVATAAVLDAIYASGLPANSASR